MTMQLTFDFDAATPVAVEVMRRAKGTLANLAGDAAETTVARSYERRGMTVAARRWRCGAGEIDLILRDGASLIFVEVKKSKTFARAAEALSLRQMQRIYAAASKFLATEPMGQLSDVRFDVALVDAQGAVCIQENAFGHF